MKMRIRTIEQFSRGSSTIFGKNALVTTPIEIPAAKQVSPTSRPAANRPHALFDKLEILILIIWNNDNIRLIHSQETGTNEIIT